MKVKNLEFDSIIYVLEMQTSGIIKMEGNRIYIIFFIQLYIAFQETPSSLKEILEPLLLLTTNITVVGIKWNLH